MKGMPLPALMLFVLSNSSASACSIGGFQFKEPACSHIENSISNNNRIALDLTHVLVPTNKSPLSCHVRSLLIRQRNEVRPGQSSGIAGMTDYFRAYEASFINGLEAAVATRDEDHRGRVQRRHHAVQVRVAVEVAQQRSVLGIAGERLGLQRMRLRAGQRSREQRGES